MNRITSVPRKQSMQNFPKNKHFLPPWYAHQGVRNVRFSGNLACFVFMKHSFWDSPFCLITDESRIKSGRLQPHQKESPTHMFFCEFCEIFQTSFFIENFRWLLLQIYHLRNANREIDSKKYQKMLFLVNALIFRSFFLGWILTFRKSYFRNFMVFEENEIGVRCCFS